MTSASRPTWTPAQGGTGLRDGSSSAPTFQFSSRDLRSHSKLKLRQPGQDAPEEVKRRDLAAELLYLERGSKLKAQQHSFETEDADADFIQHSESDVEAEGRLLEGPPRHEEESPEPTQDEEEDDTEALLRELEKIKKEREKERIYQEKLAAEEHEARALASNPLMAQASPVGFTVRRRWDDDVVFKNQARGVHEDKPKKRFINDTIRSDFHRKFIDRYIK